VNPSAVQRQLKSLAANTRARRIKLGMTQAALSEAAGLQPRHLQNLEYGRVNISIATLVRLAEALRVSPGHLLRRARLPKARRGRPPKRGSRP
jgi:transcriptional regulator with XRE-family HTH domain